MPRPSHAVLHHWIVPCVATVLLYAGFQALSVALLGVSLKPKAVPADLLLHCILALGLRALSRNTPAFVALLTVLMGLVHLGNAMKIAILGGPLMPDDAASLRTLFLLLDGGWLALAIAAGAALALALLAAITLRPWRARLAAGGFGALAFAMAFAPGPLVAAMDGYFGNVVWDQHANYGWRGPLVHGLQETVRYAARHAAPPDREAVMAATDFLRPGLGPVALTKVGAAPLVPAALRNVHMIVLESFWDPSVLKAAGLTRDPFVAEFRALWDATGRSRALSPVFGGYTANAEFEALCGFPVSDDAVFFEGRLRRDAPCLPRVLDGLGYRSFASHPNVAVFWNRVHAYRRAGFETYWSKRDFVLDDMNGSFLGDASLYRQVMEKVTPFLDAGVPTFNYILTFFGHLDYPLAENRPPVVATRDADERLALYANTVHYKSKELMALLDTLRERDPDSLIVVFGDHLPFLGPNNEQYVASGVLGESRSSFTDAMFVDSQATPLIVIDGRRGPLRLGDLPLYKLPSLVLDLLGHRIDTPMRLTRSGDALQIRPLPGMHVVRHDDGEIAVCRGQARDPAVCMASAAWLAAVNTLAADIFSGRQHTLREGLVPTPLPAPSRKPYLIEGQRTVPVRPFSSG